MEREAVVEAVAGLHDEVVDGAGRERRVEDGDDVALVGGEGDLELGGGIDLEGGGAGHGDLRYRPCRSPSTPESGASSATSSRSWGPTPRRCARAGPRSTWPRTSWSASATCAPRRGSCSAGASSPPSTGSWTRAKATGYRHARRPCAQRSARSARWRSPGCGPSLNLNEYVVHHEDVRRANGLGPRTDRDDLQDAVWGLLRHQARLMLRKVDGRLRCACSAPAGASVVPAAAPRSRLAGEPVELLLYLFGRRGAAEVELSGDAAAQARLRDRLAGDLDRPAARCRGRAAR